MVIRVVKPNSLTSWDFKCSEVMWVHRMTLCDFTRQSHTRIHAGTCMRGNNIYSTRVLLPRHTNHAPVLWISTWKHASCQKPHHKHTHSGTLHSHTHSNKWGYNHDTHIHTLTHTSSHTLLIQQFVLHSIRLLFWLASTLELRHGEVAPTCPVQLVGSIKRQDAGGGMKVQG